MVIARTSHEISRDYLYNVINVNFLNFHFALDEYHKVTPLTSFRHQYMLHVYMFCD